MPRMLFSVQCEPKTSDDSGAERARIFNIWTILDTEPVCSQSSTDTHEACSNPLEALLGVHECEPSAPVKQVQGTSTAAVPSDYDRT